jgi:hypothetical protein
MVTTRAILSARTAQDARRSAFVPDVAPAGTRHQQPSSGVAGEGAQWHRAARRRARARILPWPGFRRVPIHCTCVSDLREHWADRLLPGALTPAAEDCECGARVSRCTHVAVGSAIAFSSIRTRLTPLGRGRLRSTTSAVVQPVSRSGTALRVRRALEHLDPVSGRVGQRYTADRSGLRPGQKDTPPGHPDIPLRAGRGHRTTSPRATSPGTRVLAAS